MVSSKEIKNKLKKLPKWVIVSTSAVLALVVFSIGLYGFYSFYYAQKVFPNTHLGSLALGGMTLNEAETKLSLAVDKFLEEPLTIRINDQAEEFRASQIKVQYDKEETLNKIFAVGREGGILKNIYIQVRSLFYPTKINPVYEYNSQELTEYLLKLSDRYDSGEVNPVIELDEGEINLIPAQIGKRYDQDAVLSFIVSSLNDINYSSSPSFALLDFEPQISENQIESFLPGIERIALESLLLEHEDLDFEVAPEQIVDWLEFTVSPKDNVVDINALGIGLILNHTEIATYTKTLSDQIYKQPIDARLTIEDGRAKIFQQSQNGYELDQEKTVEVIIDSLISRLVAGIKSDQKNSEIIKVALPVKDVSPVVTDTAIEDLGIKELIGTGTTDFSGSPNNRVHNINNGTEYLKGLLIKPGEEFSTVGALGEVDASTGYLPELVIKENKTIPEYGGGLCQVSTTLFRAVLDAGLNVTERRNHSYRVSYYEREVGPGLDATVYLPKPDFKFVNDTPGWVLIQGRVEGRKLTFELFGTDDGRKVSLDGPHILWTKAAPAPLYIDDSSLAPGETRQIEKPHTGAKTIATYKVFDKDGKEMHNQDFVSIYKALPAQYLRGPEVQPENQGSEDGDQNLEESPVQEETNSSDEVIEDTAPEE